LKGHEIDVRIIKLNKKRGNIVASRKQLLEEDQSEKRTKTLEQLHEDAILTGSVKNLTIMARSLTWAASTACCTLPICRGTLDYPRDFGAGGAIKSRVKVLKFRSR